MLFVGRSIFVGHVRLANEKLDAEVLSRYFFFFQAEDGIRDLIVTGVQTCALPISTRVTPASIAALMTFSAPITLVWIASNGLYSQEGICLSAAAWNTTSTPCMARSSRAWSRTSPTKKRSEGWSMRCWKRAIISDCFSSSRLNTTSRRGRYRFSMISTNLFPNEPVPPVTSTEVSLQSSVPSWRFAFTPCLRVVWGGVWAASLERLDLP